MDSFEEISRGCRSLDFEVAENFISYLKTYQNQCGQILIIGNGGSASIATHIATDFSKMAGLPARYLGDHNYLTCVGNDYGFENIYSKGIEWYAQSEDLLIAVSSSGASENIVRAIDAARAKGLKIATFSGFLGDNAIRTKGDWNFWVDSTDYNTIEMVHHIWLVRMCDFLSSTS